MRPIPGIQRMNYQAAALALVSLGMLIGILTLVALDLRAWWLTIEKLKFEISIFGLAISRRKFVPHDNRLRALLE